jgi:hypothetical protein
VSANMRLAIRSFYRKTNNEEINSAFYQNAPINWSALHR